MANPYASYLSSLDPIAVITQTPQTISELISHLSLEQLNRAHAPDKWSVREILCHLADLEMVFAVRLRQSLAQPLHLIQPFDQDDWAVRYKAPKSQYTAASAFALFHAARTWDLQLIASATPEDFARPLSHPELGDITFRTIIETLAGHDLNHIGQIEQLAR